MHIRNNVSPAFTIIELMVVIGIIALLIGLLLPTLAKAKQEALSTACAANLHAIGQEFQVYMQSKNHDIFPASPVMPTVNDPGPITTEQGGLVFNPPPIQCVVGNVPPPSTIPAPNWTPPANNNGDPVLWRCPADINPFTTSGPPAQTYPNYFTAEGTSYQYNMLLAGDKLENLWIGLPANTVNVSLQTTDAPVLADMSTFHGPSGQPSSVNILFADWHVGHESSGIDQSLWPFQ